MEKYKNINKVKSAWLSSIPDTWKAEKLRAIFTERKEKNSPVKTTNVLSLTNTSGVIPYEQKGNVGNKSKENLEDYHLAYPNDIVLNSMNVVIGSVGLSKYYGAISPVYYALMLNDDKLYNIKYFDYVFKCKSFQKSLKCIGNGILEIRMRIPMQKLKYELLPVPPRTEQDQIVKFLDWKISSINKQISDLNIKKNSLKRTIISYINELYSKFDGRNEVRLKMLGKFIKGGGFSRENLDNNKMYPAILYGDIYTQYNYETEDINHYIDDVAFFNASKIKYDSIVFAGTGETKDEIGKAILYTGQNEVAIGGDVIAFIPNKGINSEYILYQLYTQKSLYLRYINGKGDIIVHIYPKSLGNTIINYIDYDKQIVVVNKIKKFISNINKYINIIEKEIEILKELKDKLIYDVVTGQVNVQDIKIPKFEYFEENVSNTTEDENIEETEE